ncbi:MAG TPA: acyl-CoA dehydrogenase family protein [Panacibacter sp.]|nr:acyl-CoA dehydrogenase family protein [Panacibacter sp.]HNP46334.1 acyl-CoA dehydrogenase family protein [Panacibacter sp.]
MISAEKKKTILAGGEWLIKATTPQFTFTPEEFTEEQKMVKDMADQFMEADVRPVTNLLEKQGPGLMPGLIEKAGELGLLGTAIPEEYGGLGRDFITTSIVCEELSNMGNCFSVSFLAHTGIGMLPILYFGTEAQRQKYIPKLVSGEWKGAYGLTEPNSGSDALGARSTARLSDDGKYYILNGQKCWITNGGFAEVYTVFAQLEDNNSPSGKPGFTAFILERGFEGFTQGPEEDKMGIKGSSTVQLYFQDCKVPVENLLGEPGKGHLIAFNILNIGRYKLCAGTIGASKGVTSISTQYAVAREQFKQPIASFGAIKNKLAEMAIRVWVCESAAYRTANLIQAKKEEGLAGGQPFDRAFLGAAEEYAIECAILKVFGSEVFDYAVDEGLQIHGGNGFSAEYAISKLYRDSRINRIYEGTNEINRLLIVDMILKRAMKGRLDLMGPAMAVSKELMSIPDFNNDDDTHFAKEKQCIANFKKAILMVAGAAVQKFMMSFDKEQEIIMNIADMAINTYMAESALLRVAKLTDTYGTAATDVKNEIMRVFLFNASESINKSGKEALYSFAEGDELRMMLIGLRRFTKMDPFNVKVSKRKIADKMIEENGYCF